MAKLTAEQLAIAEALAKAADEEGLIQAEDMLELCRRHLLPSGNPRLHTVTTLANAFAAAGLPDDTAEQLWG